MLIVAFNLGGTKKMTFYDDWSCVAAQGESAGEEKRTSGNYFFWLAHVRNNWLHRLLGAGGHASHCQGCAHQLEKAAARNGVQPLRRAFGEFAMQHLLKFGTAS